MKRTTLFLIILLLGCEDKPKYKDLSVIFLGEKKYDECLDKHSVSECDFYIDGPHRRWDIYHRGTELYKDDFDWKRDNVSVIHRRYNKVKYLHYYEDEGYIEFEEVGVDEVESLDLSKYVVIDFEERS